MHIQANPSRAGSVASCNVIGLVVIFLLFAIPALGNVTLVVETAEELKEAFIALNANPNTDFKIHIVKDISFTTEFKPGSGSPLPELVDRPDKDDFILLFDGASITWNNEKLTPTNITFMRVDSKDLGGSLFLQGFFEGIGGDFSKKTLVQPNSPLAFGDRTIPAIQGFGSIINATDSTVIIGGINADCAGKCIEAEGSRVVVFSSELDCGSFCVSVMGVGENNQPVDFEGQRDGIKAAGFDAAIKAELLRRINQAEQLLTDYDVAVVDSRLHSDSTALFVDGNDSVTSPARVFVDGSHIHTVGSGSSAAILRDTGPGGMLQNSVLSSPDSSIRTLRTTRGALTAKNLYIEAGEQAVTVTEGTLDLSNTAISLNMAVVQANNSSVQADDKQNPNAACSFSFGGDMINSSGYNTAEDDSCGLNHATDLTNTDPMVVVDADGIPQPQPGSPLIESGPVDFVNNILPCSYKDFNGLGRPQDFDLDGIFACDRFLVEIQGGPDIGAPQTSAYAATGRGGEGSFVEILANGQAIISFYTYSLDGTSLAWFMGLGRVVGNSIVIDEMQRVTGGVFGAGFDEASIVRTTVGGMSMVFPECDGTANPGRLNFTARSDSGLEHLLNDANRLTFVVNCDGTKGANAQRSGAFFALGRSGEGIFVQWLSDGRVVLVFYTFDAAGNPFWTTSDIGNTVVNGNTVTANMLYAMNKTKFGANFEPAEVTMAPWCTFTLTFTDDDSFNFAHNSEVAGFTPGNHAYVRITQPLGTKTVAQGN